MSFTENVEPMGEALPDDPMELQKLFNEDRSYLMRLAAKLTHAAQNLELTSASFDQLEEVNNEIDKVKKHLCMVALKLGHASEALPHLINRDIEAAS